MKTGTVTKPKSVHKYIKEYYIINLLHVSVILVAIQREVYYKGWILISIYTYIHIIP
jgi:hypothetical protein